MCEEVIKAQEFAKKYGVTLESKYLGRLDRADVGNNNWESDDWQCVLYCQSSDETYLFEFHMGIGLGGKEPEIYDVLACLQKYDPGTIDEFIKEYGYTVSCWNDVAIIRDIYDGCCNEYDAMKRLFPESEMWEELCEIC